MNQLKYAGVTLVIGLVWSGISFAADCSIEGFKTYQKSDASDLERLSYLSEMSSSEWSNGTHTLNSGGNYYGITGHEEYNDMQSKAKAAASLLATTSDSDIRRAWAMSTLTADGVKAYAACLNGFAANVESLGESSALINVSWVAPPYASINAPAHIFSPVNVANLKDIQAQLGTTAWGSRTKNLQITLIKKDPSKEAFLTIAAGPDQSIVAYAPPRPLKYTQTPANIAQQSCHSGGNYDGRECVVYDDQYEATIGGDVKVFAAFSSVPLVQDLSVPPDSNKACYPNDDPHRLATITVYCGSKNTGLHEVGKHFVKSTIFNYFATTTCTVKKGEDLNIKVVAIPRGCTQIDFSGNDSLDVVEMERR